MSLQPSDSVKDQYIIDLIREAFLYPHPCREMLRFMKLNNISEKEMADCLAINLEQMHKILFSGGLITEDQAALLELLFDKPAKEWMEMQEVFVNDFTKAFTVNVS